jgi:carbamoyltransferase
LKNRVPEIPPKSILGLNYSGLHDSAIAAVSPKGELLFACALERITRIKQDGRPPTQLLEMLPLKRFATVAVSTNQALDSPLDDGSKVHPITFAKRRLSGLVHGPKFQEFLSTIPAQKEFVDHHFCHASSAFWLSGFREALCFIYDGGMFNSPWFGGVYVANRKSGIEPLDLFSSARYAKITTLYSFVTALLGFTPNKHEGKITGLAGFGKPNPECCESLLKLLRDECPEIEGIAEWLYQYADATPPIFAVNEVKRKGFLDRFSTYSREEIAASVQFLAEEHVLAILKKCRELGFHSDNICLAGGLFANVRINQRVKQFGFKNLFVVPPMTDDGTSLGAALAVASRNRGFIPRGATTMSVGPSYKTSEIVRAVEAHSLEIQKIKDPVDYLARELANGKIVAVYQGAMEFGPRALGNRSIIAQATRPEINQELNARLCRTEFMPFAPITRVEDRERCYVGLEGAEHTAEFMTITCECTDIMKKQSPAVVHIDGTARPQLVRKEHHSFLHGLLTRYHELTGIMSLINTSFNIHEEPIVCSPQDAIEGFLESGIDLLYFEGGFVIEAEKNASAALSLLRNKRSKPTQKEQKLLAVNFELTKRVLDAVAGLEAKQREIEATQKVAADRARLLLEKEEGSGAIQEVAVGRAHARVEKGEGEGFADVEAVQIEELLLCYFLSEKVKVKHMIDVGAHHGFTLEPFLLAGWTVDAFEPVEQNLAELKRSFGKTPGLRIHSEAVSSKSAQMDFHIARRQDGSLHDFYHSLEQIAEDAYHRKGETVKVRTVSLDDLITGGQLPKKVGFLKTDTEGHDLKVLLGAKSLVSDVVSVEFWRDGHPLGKSPSPAEKIIDLMRKRGYESFLVINHEGLDVELQFSTFDASETAWGNIVFFSNQQTLLYDQCVRFSGSFRLLSGMRSSLSNTAEERLKLIQELTTVAEGRGRELLQKEREIAVTHQAAEERSAALLEKEELISAIRKAADERAAALEEQEELIRSLKTFARDTQKIAEERGRDLLEKEREIVATQEAAEERASALLEKEQEIAGTKKVAEERAAALLEKEREIVATQEAAEERASALLEKEQEIAGTKKVVEERAAALLEKEREIVATQEVAKERSKALLEKEAEIASLRNVARERQKSLNEKEQMISSIHEVAQERARLLQEKEDIIRSNQRVAEDRFMTIQTLAQELEEMKKDWGLKFSMSIRRVLKKVQRK